jgi:hypothetical protein
LLIEQLFIKINELSTKVEQLLKSESESECESLLVQRQSLLEQLAENVAKSTDDDPSSELLSQYYEFLKSVQKRDALSIAFALKQSKNLLVASTKQAKSKKAIKAYQKVL